MSQASAATVCLILKADPREGPHQTGHLREFADLHAWAKRAGIVTDSDARKIALKTKGGSRIAARAFKRAIDL
jgi:hypothetical protein